MLSSIFSIDLKLWIESSISFIPFRVLFWSVILQFEPPEQTFLDLCHTFLPHNNVWEEDIAWKAKRMSAWEARKSQMDILRNLFISYLTSYSCKIDSQ